MIKRVINIKFKIHEEVTGEISLNKFYEGMHWAKRKEIADYWHMLTKAELSNANIKREFIQKPVDIIIRADSNLDADNHGALIKLIIDGMCGFILKEDDKRYIKSVKFEFYDEEGIEVELKKRG
ncbi:MAG: hypothetical protein ACQEQF_00545 [Bacillota bacterium]